MHLQSGLYLVFVVRRVRYVVCSPIRVVRPACETSLLTSIVFTEYAVPCRSLPGCLFFCLSLSSFSFCLLSAHDPMRAADYNGTKRAFPC